MDTILLFKHLFNETFKNKTAIKPLLPEEVEGGKY